MKFILVILFVSSLAMASESPISVTSNMAENQTVNINVDFLTVVGTSGSPLWFCKPSSDFDLYQGYYLSKKKPDCAGGGKATLYTSRQFCKEEGDDGKIFTRSSKKGCYDNVATVSRGPGYKINRNDLSAIDESFQSCIEQQKKALEQAAKEPTISEYLNGKSVRFEIVKDRKYLPWSLRKSFLKFEDGELVFRSISTGEGCRKMVNSEEITQKLALAKLQSLLNQASQPTQQTRCPGS